MVFKVLPALQVDWLWLMSETFKTHTNYSIDENEDVIVLAPDFLSNMSSLVEQMMQNNDNRTYVTNVYVIIT